MKVEFSQRFLASRHSSEDIRDISIQCRRQIEDLQRALESNLDFAETCKIRGKIEVWRDLLAAFDYKPVKELETKAGYEGGLNMTDVPYGMPR